MKKLLISILLSSACLSLFAQTEGEPKKSDNLYLGIGIGGMSVINDGFNTPTVNGHIQLGQYVTPTWGWRAEVAGAWQTLKLQKSGYSQSWKPYGELNLDATINLLNLFGKSDWERKFNLYIFGGPQITMSSAVSLSQNAKYVWTKKETSEAYVLTLAVDPKSTKTSFTSEGALARVGATAGLGLNYFFNDKLAIKAEARYGVAPSAFGYGSDCSFAESTLRATIGLVFSLTPKRHNSKPQVCPVCPTCPACPVVKPCPAPEPCPVAASSMEVAPEGKEAATRIQDNQLAVFFKINESVVTRDDYAKIAEYAAYIKANPDAIFTVVGYADKGTGTKAYNKAISQRRANAVYEILLRNGVNREQLNLIAAGGVGVMFNNDEVYSRVAVVKSL